MPGLKSLRMCVRGGGWRNNLNKCPTDPLKSSLPSNGGGWVRLTTEEFELGRCDVRPAPGDGDGDGDNVAASTYTTVLHAFPRGARRSRRRRYTTVYCTSRRERGREEEGETQGIGPRPTSGEKLYKRDRRVGEEEEDLREREREEACGVLGRGICLTLWGGLPDVSSFEILGEGGGQRNRHCRVRCPTFDIRPSAACEKARKKPPRRLVPDSSPFNPRARRVVYCI